jgi:hypothetical protein
MWLTYLAVFLAPRAAALAFEPTAQPGDNQKCKTFPGDPAWPSPQEWSQLNASVNGALLAPRPPGSVCYKSSPTFDLARCDFLVNNASTANPNFWFQDPISVLVNWPQGNTCIATKNATGDCTQGAFPSVVVNATTVGQVQGAVSFARKKNLRLVIK